MPERPDHRPAARSSARRRPPGARRLATCATAVIALTVTALAGPAPATAALPADACADGLGTIVWDGSGADGPGEVGDGETWGDRYNWDHDCVPGYRDQTPGRVYDDAVHIPAGATVALASGESAHVGTLTNEGTLTVTGATLETWEDSSSHTLVLSDGFLVGKATFTVTSELLVTNSTQSSRRCGWVEVGDCSSEPTASEVGTTVIGPAARMVLSGYLNLDDLRVIDNRGTVTLAKGTDGRIAADDGTLFRNRARFLVRNDGGYYQGNIPSWSPPRSAFLNTGRVQKSATAALSLIDARYADTDPEAPGTGEVSVQAGVLSIASLGTTATREATVRSGATLGNGSPEGCDPVAGGVDCTRVVPTAADPALTTVRVPHTTSVSIEELQSAPSPGFLTAPVEIETPDARATRSSPLYFTILIEATTLGGRTANQVARRSSVQRKASAAAPWVTLPSCGKSQKPTRSKKTCVARSRSVQGTASLGSGDAVIVIASLQNSRYRVG